MSKRSSALAAPHLLLFFTKRQSGPARRMESLVAHLARKERARLRVSRVDIDEQPELATALQISDVPTLVLVSGRKPVARLEGRASAPQIEGLIAPFLADERPAATAA